MNQLTEQIEIKNKRISGVSTSVIATILILFLILMQFKIDPPPPEEEGGVAVSLGEPDAGGPEEVPVEAYQEPATPTFQPREAVEQTSDDEAVAVPKTPEVIKKNETPKEPEEDDLIKSMRESAKNNQNKPANSGDGTKPGAQGAKNGVPGGDPKGTGGDGGGPGKGIGTGTAKSTTHSFVGRKINEPSNNENCGEKGTVIIDVILKADGTVVPVDINPSTKSSNTCLRNLAMKLARKTTFSPLADAKNTPGTITFKFTF
jgi:outer membrane biosynthesis protein TonB